MCIRDRALYRSQESDVNEGYFTLPIGKAATINEGDQITIISYGLGIKWVQDWLNENKEVSCDLYRALCSKKRIGFGSSNA